MQFLRIFIKSLAASALVPTLATAEPATATAALLGGFGGIFVQRSQGPSTNIGVASHGWVAYPADTNNPGYCQAVATRNDVPDGSAAVRKDEAVAVALKHVVLGSDLHVPFQFPDLLSNRIQIAIVANAFEMCGGPDCTGGFNFRPDADQDGRVVYFSNDVTKAQRTLSFGALPMFGPFVHNGNPVGFSLHVVKLANDQSANLGPMMTTLAALGKQAGAGLSPEVSSVLNSIGSNLLKGFDVRLLRYDTLLYSAATRDDRSLGIPKFYYGDYIVVRKEDREKEFDFSSYSYSPKTGKLYLDSGCEESKEATDVTYGVIQVLKADQAAGWKHENLRVLQAAIASLAAEQGPNLSGKAVGDMVRARAFKADLDLVRAAKAFKKDGDTEAKERLLAILQKVKGSQARAIPPAQKNADDYERGQFEQLMNAITVYAGNVDWQNDSAKVVYDKISAQWT